MREVLRSMYNNNQKTANFEGVIKEVYYLYEKKQRTILLSNITCNNNEVAKHCWILEEDLKNRYIRKNLNNLMGDRIKFTANIVRYYHLRATSKVLDYNIKNLRQIELVA